MEKKSITVWLCYFTSLIFQNILQSSLLQQTPNYKEAYGKIIDLNAESPQILLELREFILNHLSVCYRNIFTSFFFFLSPFLPFLSFLFYSYLFILLCFQFLLNISQTNLSLSYLMTPYSAT